MLSIVSADEGRLALWHKIPGLSGIEAHPANGAFGRCYFPAVYGDRRQDVSFAVTEDGEPLLLTIVTVGEGQLDWFGRPLRLFPRADLSATIKTVVLRTAFAHLDALAAQYGVTRIRVRDDGDIGTLSAIGEQCLARRASGLLRLTALADLTDGEAGLRRGLRKSF